MNEYRESLEDESESDEYEVKYSVIGFFTSYDVSLVEDKWFFEIDSEMLDLLNSAWKIKI